MAFRRSSVRFRLAPLKNLAKQAKPQCLRSFSRRRSLRFRRALEKFFFSYVPPPILFPPDAGAGEWTTPKPRDFTRRLPPAPSNITTPTTPICTTINFQRSFLTFRIDLKTQAAITLSRQSGLVKEAWTDLWKAATKSVSNIRSKLSMFRGASAFFKPTPGQLFCPIFRRRETPNFLSNASIWLSRRSTAPIGSSSSSTRRRR